MRIFYLLVIPALLMACNETPAPAPVESTPEQTTVPTEKLSKRDQLKLHTESVLRILGNEKYEYAFYEAECTGDDSVDIILTVNLLDRALNEAIASNNVAKRAEMGYIGRFNYIAFMDGATQEISDPIVIPSSPHAQLSVSFEPIVAAHKNDILVDYRIRNSGFREFITIYNATPKRILQLKQFDGLGDKKTEAYVFKYQPGTYSSAQDVLVYKAKLEDVTINDPLEIYSIDPVITPTNELERTWYFNRSQLKYFTLEEQ